MIRLSNHDARALVTLLGVLQTHLESAIESSLIPDTNQAMPEDRWHVAADRARWKRAERLVMRLDRSLHRARRAA